MWQGEVIVDYNGIVLFAPDLLKQFYHGQIVKGTDLFTRYITTDEGDTVLTLVSYDNYTLIQRTLLLQITLVEGVAIPRTPGQANGGTLLQALREMNSSF